MSLFRCPLCAAPLTRGEHAYTCPVGHSFDLAAAGYTHLLPANRKHSKNPGDDKAMVCLLYTSTQIEGQNEPTAEDGSRSALGHLPAHMVGPGVEGVALHQPVGQQAGNGNLRGAGRRQNPGHPLLPQHQGSQNQSRPQNGPAGKSAAGAQVAVCLLYTSRCV